ncbi:MAG TPA: HtpX-like protease, partial [Asanoa sp.]|nr:HtpX-like protease [Asanoa sp.]
DTHPPIGVRVAAIAKAPEIDRVPDTRRSGALLPDLTATGRRMQELMVDVGDRQVLPWPEFTAAAIAAAEQREADSLLRAAARITGTPQANLESILDIVAGGRLADFAAPFFENATRQEAVAAFAGPMTMLLRVAAVRSGAGHWQHSWSKPAEFVGADGKPLPLHEIAELAVVPQSLDEARERLAGLGIDPAVAGLVEERVTARGAQVIGGFANVAVDGHLHDLLLLTNGLVLVSDPGKVEKGQERLRAMVGSVPAELLAERNRFLPYEEVAAAVIEKRTPVWTTLTLHDGSQLAIRAKWDGQFLESKSRKTFLEMLGQL